MSIGIISNLQQDLLTSLKADIDLKELVKEFHLNVPSRMSDIFPLLILKFKTFNNCSTPYRCAYSVEFSTCIYDCSNTHILIFKIAKSTQQIIESNNFPMNTSYEIVSIKQTQSQLKQEEMDLIKLDVQYKAYIRQPI